MALSAITRQALSALQSSADVAALGGLDAVVRALGTDVKRGLPAAQVTANREAFGENKLPSKQPRSFFSHLKEAFEDTTLKILVASAAFSMLFGVFLSDKTADVIQGMAIVAAVVIVSGVNSFQNWSKDREFQSLAKLKADRPVQVLRDGQEQTVSIYSIVVGDIIILNSGDGLPADGLLLSGFDIEVDQSSMTGESESVRKAALSGGGAVPAGGDPLLIGGCMLLEGEGRMLVTAVGTASKIGQTVSLVEDTPTENTPLQEKLTALAEEIGRIGTAAGVLTFLVLTGLWWFGPPSPEKSLTDLLRFFIVGVTIVVVAVPEGLPLAVTISLAFSMRRMMKDNNLVRELQACETMGSATVIASDKTGTLTQNRMSVVQAWVFGRHYERLERMRAGINNPGAVHRLAKAIALNSTAELRVEGPRVEFVRNPSEGALLLMLLTHLGADYVVEREAAGAPLARRAFKKETKYMTTIAAPEAAGEGPIAYTKGAPEIVMELCRFTQAPNGVLAPITPEVRFNLKEQVDAMARLGLRTLAVAYRRLPRVMPGSDPVDWSSAIASGEVEADMTLLGMFGVQDPLREGVADAVARCNSAGIRVLMVTGDHRDTAAHIATACGILRPGGVVMEGPQFRLLEDGPRRDVCAHLAVLARSSPTDKHLLVVTLKEMGEVVAVTGDGTNDAPALRAADVGLAMGIAGTEVAKEASDIVILDDRFASIVASVKWGRSIKENIRKFLTFQLTINMVALTLTFVTVCANGGSTDSFPITPVQLLWVNLIMDSFAALALATEPPSEHLLDFAPQGKAERLITTTMMKNMLGHAIFQTVLLLWLTLAPSGAALYGVAEIGSVAHYTVVFNTFVFLQVFNLFNCRTVRDEWNVLADFSSAVIGQVIVAIIVVMQVIIVQFGGSITQTLPLTAGQWAICVGVGFTSVPVGYFLKLVPACDKELRKLAPPRPHFPSGPLYGEGSTIRGAFVRAMSEAVEADASGPATPAFSGASFIHITGGSGGAGTRSRAASNASATSAGRAAAAGGGLESLAATSSTSRHPGAAPSRRGIGATAVASGTMAADAHTGVADSDDDTAGGSGDSSSGAGGGGTGPAARGAMLQRLRHRDAGAPIQAVAEPATPSSASYDGGNGVDGTGGAGGVPGAGPTSSGGGRRRPRRAE